MKERMKGIALTLTLVVLTLTEVYLCVAFLPIRWQRAVDASLSHILPQDRDYSAITHPELDHEIEQVLQQNPYLRIAAYAAIVLLLAGNTFLWWRVQKSLRRSRYSAGGALRR